MSQENLDVVKRCFELFGRGETEALLRYVDPAIETNEGAEMPGAADYFGHAGLAKAVDHWASQWDDFRVELTELIDAGSDVVAVTRHYGTGRASGVAVEAVVAYVFTVDDGKLVRMRIFNTKAEALEAVGPREQAMSRENVQVVRRAFESFNRRDLAGAVAALARDAEWVPYLAALEAKVYRGRDAIEGMWREVLRVVPDLRMEFVRVVADSPDAVVLEIEFRGMGNASGADIRTTLFQAASFRDGKVKKVQGFRTAREALLAVGLRG